MAKMILSYNYELKTDKLRYLAFEYKAEAFRVFGKDSDDNNVLHLCALHNMPEVKRLIHRHEFVTKIKEGR